MKQGWIDDKRLSQIPHDKLLRLKQLADSTDQSDRARQMQVLTSLIKDPKSLQLSFAPDELDTLMTVLKEYASPAELALLARAMRMFQKS